MRLPNGLRGLDISDHTQCLLPTINTSCPSIGCESRALQYVYVSAFVQITPTELTIVIIKSMYFYKIRLGILCVHMTLYSCALF